MGKPTLEELISLEYAIIAVRDVAKDSISKQDFTNYKFPVNFPYLRDAQGKFKANAEKELSLLKKFLPL
ncbi:MAG TPA: hypothetical protein PLP33_25335 [Leptospiraceae bacterium]|nr:hypothetical protein [Leptospiraceae bacterium]